MIIYIFIVMIMSLLHYIFITVLIRFSVGMALNDSPMGSAG